MQVEIKKIRGLEDEKVSHLNKVNCEWRVVNGSYRAPLAHLCGPLTTHDSPLTKKAFTLAEVLITLGIIGIVSALTMPTLIAKYREKATVTAVKEAYSIFSQAYLRVVGEHDNLIYLVDSEKSAKENAVTMFKELSKYIKKVKSCDTDTGNCMADEIYTNLIGNPIHGKWDEYANLQTGILSNGISFFIVSTIDEQLSENNHYLGQVGIDINGNKKPNRLGYDFFIFQVDSKGRVMPVGTEFVCSISPLTCPNGNRFHRCNNNPSSSETYDGYACTAWILENGNMNYPKFEVQE